MLSHISQIIRFLLPQIKEKKAALYVNVGDYHNVWEELLKEIPEMGHYAKEHFNDWEDTKKFAEDALNKDVIGIHGFWHENIFEAVYCTLMCHHRSPRNGLLPTALRYVRQHCKK